MEQTGNIDRKTLSAVKRALLAKRVAQKPALDIDPKVIARRPHGNRAPLSFEQERVLSLVRSEGRLTYYSSVFRLTGPLNIAALESALNGLVERHETLRTRLLVIDGDMSQVVHPARPVALPFIDITRFSKADVPDAAIRMSKVIAGRRFDTADESLYRVALLRSSDDHFLLFTILHIVADRQSMGVVFGELATLYSALSEGRPSPLVELTIQYGDYAYWQRNRAEESAFTSELSFWKEQLRGCNTLLRLPLSYPRPRSLTYKGRFQFIHIADDLSESLRELCRKEGVTLFMAMFAAFNLLLHSYTGQDDILVSVPLAKRNRTELEGLIGCFTNNLVMRTRLSGDPTYRELLHQVRDSCLRAYSHQDLPFERLLAELRPAEVPGYLPLVQVGFGLQKPRASDISIPRLQVDQIAIGAERAVLDLMARVEELPRCTIISFQYKTDLFSDERMSRMLSHYKVLLEAVSRDPCEPVSRVSSGLKAGLLVD